MTNVNTLLNDPDTAGVWSLDPDRSTVGFSQRASQFYRSTATATATRSDYRKPAALA